jgi:hypothetical protein
MPKHKLKKPEETITLFPRIINNTHMFTEDETALLNKGLKYNLKYKPKIGSKH